MEQWMIEAIQALLGIEIKELEAGERVYTSSPTYGSSRYHLLNKRYDGVQIEQVNIDDKWGSRVNLHTDEIPAVLKTLISWHLADVKEKQESQESLDHPF